MPGDRDRSTFLALALDPKVKISFSGKRVYRLEEIEAEGEEAASLSDQNTITARLIPVEHPLCFSPDQEDDVDYRDWLDENGMNDPIWDEVLLPTYRSLVVFPDGFPRAIRLRVEIQSMSRTPVLRLSLV